jgi:Tol biopolymer transport system component
MDFSSKWYPSMVDINDERKGYHIKRFTETGETESVSVHGDERVIYNYSEATEYAEKINKEGEQ